MIKTSAALPLSSTDCAASSLSSLLSMQPVLSPHCCLCSQFSLLTAVYAASSLSSTDCAASSLSSLLSMQPVLSLLLTMQPVLSPLMTKQLFSLLY